MVTAGGVSTVMELVGVVAIAMLHSSGQSVLYRSDSFMAFCFKHNNHLKLHQLSCALHVNHIKLLSCVHAHTVDIRFSCVHAHIVDIKFSYVHVDIRFSCVHADIVDIR